jgi:hypothetical protein
MRMSVMHAKYNKAESDLYNPSNLPIKTISEISTDHTYYSFETPIDLKMKLIYEKQNDYN